MDLTKGIIPMSNKAAIIAILLVFQDIFISRTILHPQIMVTCELKGKYDLPHAASTFCTQFLHIYGLVPTNCPTIMKRIGGKYSCMEVNWKFKMSYYIWKISD